MLKRQVKYIHGEGAQREREVQYAEVNHFKDNFALMATVSALLAGFEFMAFGLDPGVGENSEVHPSNVVFMVAATGTPPPERVGVLTTGRTGV